MPTIRYRNIREECCAANLRLSQTGLVDLTFGNVSVLDMNAGVIAIKPSGVPYQELRPTNMVILDLEGNTIEGSLKPSSDTPTHLRLYKAFAEKGLRSIVHTHSRAAVAFAQAGRDIPCFGTTHADHFHGSVPVTREMTPAEIEDQYELNTANVIIERFREIEPLAVPAVLVRGHGPFVWNDSADKAVEYAEALEICADMALKTLALNPSATAIAQPLLDKHFLRKHGAGAYYGQR